MIYVIKTGDYFKVGYAKDVSKRMKDYRCHNPTSELINTYEGNIRLEKYVHKKLKKWHHRLEWFNIFKGFENQIENIINDYNPIEEEVVDREHLSNVEICDKYGNYFSLDQYAEINSISKKAMVRKLKNDFSRGNCIITSSYSKQLNCPRTEYNFVEEFVKNLNRVIKRIDKNTFEVTITT